MKKQLLTILGATGSIGVSTLDVVSRHPERYQVYALCAHTQTDLLLQQCQRFQPVYAVVRDEGLAQYLQGRISELGLRTEVLAGEQALIDMAKAPEVDMVMAAIVGAAGLKPTLAAAQAGKRIMLANKEVLVMAGALFMDAVKRHGAVLLPVDSEHNAIFQSLPMNFERQGLAAAGVSKILLTASGGPFRNTPMAELLQVTPEQACAHPNWSMGRKISVDSASMMNKGLEVIEAHWLFAATPDMIEVVVHPQSVIHSLVQYTDGSVLAQLGNPDMRTPIAYALSWPERITAGVPPLDLCQIARLDFFSPDFERFPCLRLAFEALREGGAAPAVLNAANEVAVAAFLAGNLPFLGIPRLIEHVLERKPSDPGANLEGLLTADQEARQMAQDFLKNSFRA